MTKRRRSPPDPMGKQPSRSSGSKLPPEDVALWQHAAQTIEPVHKLKPRVPDKGNLAPNEASAADAFSLYVTPAEMPVSAATGLPAVSPGVQKKSASPRQPKHLPPPPLAEFDRRKARKIASGKHDIEARIDLHGMRQGEAHQELRGFLMSCVVRGLSTVLVITGKGARIPDEDTGRDWMSDTPDRGVLRRMVPLWLAEPDLRALVIGFHSAGVRHGGDGAIYVQLRKRAAIRPKG